VASETPRLATKESLVARSETGDSAALLPSGFDTHSELASKGLRTLSAMRSATYREAFAVLARGRVLTEEEWHLLNGFVVNDADGVLSETERKHADRLIHEFRQKNRLSPGN
jgi:hypothetical protein